MADIQVVVSNPDEGTAYTIEVDGQDANRFMGREIGDEVDGDAVGLSGYTLEITGGSDETGRPMRPDVAGAGVKELLLSEASVGYNPSRDGERRRLSVRGREISDETAQVNARVVEAGDDSFDDLLGDD